ncbi:MULTISPECIES: V-type ATPase subunit [Terrabacteria group]|uniref:V-type ATPase subunit n=1 Tax=Bacillati TaxID=1783272 RepID=UPI00193A0507|nr:MULTISPECIES: V-type ATPase subunit [Terrabacteria group]MBW9212314.1 V-type ATPase subunit [Trueperella sp. zg.1013]QRG86149.1 V-type ATPase subunit [Bulleidia sp. zg-1006]
MAKVRSMYGHRLQESDYLSLLNKKSEAEVATFLQNSELFHDCLTGINVKAIHRGQLEVLIRTEIFHRINKLIRYMEADGKHLVHNLMANTEIELIMMKIRALSSNNSVSKEDLITHMPLYVSQYSSFDFMGLSEVSDFEELLHLLKGTAYATVLKLYRSKPIEELDFVTLEHRLHERMDEEMMMYIRQFGHEDTQKKMNEIVKIVIELENIQIIYRLKKYFQSKPEQIRPLLMKQSVFIPWKTLMEWLDTLNADQILEKLQQTRYKKYIGFNHFQYIEHFTKRIQYELNRHLIYQELNPNILMFAYIHLSEIEIQNLIDIIEAVHYGISQDRTRALLIY